MTRNIIIYTLIFFFAIILYSARASALMVPISTEELTLGSDIVLRGRVVSVRSEWDENAEILFTKATVVVKENIAGFTMKKRVIVEYPGGTFGLIKMEVSDSPEMHFGEDVILFLENANSMKSREYNPVHNIRGAAQGKYSIGTDGIARKSGFAVVKTRDNFAARTAEDAIDNNLPVEDLIQKIKDIDTIE